MSSTPLGPIAPPHTVDRTPEYEEFMTRLRDYHQKRGTQLDPEPKVGSSQLDLLKVFNHVVTNGGYDKISEEKLAWRRIAHELGIVSTNEASTAFSLKEKFYKNLAAFEISTVHGKEPPPKDILEDVTAKGAGLLNRTRENFRGARSSGFGVDSAASGDDMTPVKERPTFDPAASGRASRGLREAPAQRVIFQPDTAPSRATRQSSAQHASHAPSPGAQQSGMHQTTVNHHMGLQGSQSSRGPSIINQPANQDDASHLINSYQPKYTKPLVLRAVATPGNAPNEFPRARPHPKLPAAAPGQAIQPGFGFDGPNIYVRCLNALRSQIPSEQAFALNHLVKISFERGDKYRFDSFPGLAEGLVEKALEIGNLFYYVNWKVSWDPANDSNDIGVLDGNDGTPDLLERIQNLVEKDTTDALQPSHEADEFIYAGEAVLTIRNMVTLPNNAHFLSDFNPLKELIIIILHLPARDTVIELKHLALDIAEQLTPFMVLGPEDLLYQTLLQQLTSEDRGVILTSLRALGRIAMNLEATNSLSDVPRPVLHRISNWLLLNDEELMDACLDFLYQYTAVVPNVDNLLRSSVTETLVDQLSRLLSHGSRRVRKHLVLTPEQRLPSQNEIVPMPEELLEEMLKLEEPERVHKWVKCFFEEDKTSFITQLAAWQAYQNAFVGPLKDMGQALITPADFIRNSTSVYEGSNAQVLREPGDPQQKFIIHGIRARSRPLTLDGSEYGECLWTVPGGDQRCRQFFIKPEKMWDHILTTHVGEQRNGDGQFENVEKDFRCEWASCHKFSKAGKVEKTHFESFARHIRTHVSSVLPESAAASRAKQRWIIPAKTMDITFEETMTVPDERNPNNPNATQAAGIPLSAVLVLRNIARNVVKTDAEEELKNTSPTGWNDRLFRAVLPRFFEVLAKNSALSPYMASLLDLIRVSTDEGDR